MSISQPEMVCYMIFIQNRVVQASEYQGRLCFRPFDLSEHLPRGAGRRVAERFRGGPWFNGIALVASFPVVGPRTVDGTVDQRGDPIPVIDLLTCWFAFEDCAGPCPLVAERGSMAGRETHACREAMSDEKS